MTKNTLKNKKKKKIHSLGVNSRREDLVKAYKWCGEDFGLGAFQTHPWSFEKQKSFQKKTGKTIFFG